MTQVYKEVWMEDELELKIINGHVDGYLYINPGLGETKYSVAIIIWEESDNYTGRVEEVKLSELERYLAIHTPPVTDSKDMID